MKQRARLNPTRPGTPYGVNRAQTVCAVACPTCKAKEGARCITASGEEATAPHSTRGRAWAAFVRRQGMRPNDVMYRNAA